MPSHTRPPLPQAASAGRKTRAGNGSTAGAMPPKVTPNMVVDLVNQGQMTVEAGDAVMRTLAQPCLKVARQATFGVRIAMQVPGDTRPAAAMAYLDATVTQAVSHMAWSEAVDESPDGYAIDPPSPPGPTTGPGNCTVHAFLRLTVSVAACRPYRFPATARELLSRDLQQLRRRGVRVGRARRWHLRQRDEDPWSIPDDDLNAANDVHGRLYDEGDLFDVDPFDPFHLDPTDRVEQCWDVEAGAAAGGLQGMRTGG